MRIVIQRVTEASVTIDGQVHSTIGSGMMVLVGVRVIPLTTCAGWRRRP